MRFWITKNSDVPIREQLVRQVMLGILSEDLPAGQRLPSIRALARRHGIHSNTVSAAYHDLLEQGWLELRRGSGLYVRDQHSTADAQMGFDRLLSTFLQTARSLGYEPEQVLQRIERVVRPRVYERIVIAEPEPEMRAILKAEIGELPGIAIEAVADPDFRDVSQFAKTLIVALPTRAAKLRRSLPDAVFCIPLRLNSVSKSLEGQSRPGPDVVVSIVSRSPEIRHWARAMLIAVGLDAEALCEIDASSPGWRERIAKGAVVVADVLAAGELSHECRARVFRVVADSSLGELEQFVRS